jgi:hypothetical protein
MARDELRPATGVSLASSTTTVIPFEKFPNQPDRAEDVTPGHNADTAIQTLQDEWENDPANARNWSLKKKWTAVFIVRSFLLLLVRPEYF